MLTCSSFGFEHRGKTHMRRAAFSLTCLTPPSLSNLCAMCKSTPQSQPASQETQSDVIGPVPNSGCLQSSSMDYQPQARCRAKYNELSKPTIIIGSCWLYVTTQSLTSNRVLNMAMETGSPADNSFSRITVNSPTD